MSGSLRCIITGGLFSPVVFGNGRRGGKFCPFFVKDKKRDCKNLKMVLFIIAEIGRKLFKEIKMLRFALCLSALLFTTLPSYAQGVYSTLEEAVSAAEEDINFQSNPLMQIKVVDSIVPVQPVAETQQSSDETEEDVETEEEAEEPSEDGEDEVATEPKVEEVVEVKVFSPKFMEKLRACEAVKETEAENEVEIVGIADGKCQLKYMDFDLNVPMNILENIHGFDDLTTLLKNQDIAHYNYQPTYTYDGLMYAVTACAKQTNYFGVQEKSLRHGTEINRGLTAEYADKVCTIKLQNDVTKDGKTEDYGVVCRLSDEVLDSLEPYFKELAEKYGERHEFAYGRARVLPPSHNQETHEADITLMYFMQQNGYCSKNHQ